MLNVSDDTTLAQLCKLQFSQLSWNNCLMLALCWCNVVMFSAFWERNRENHSRCL